MRIAIICKFKKSSILHGNLLLCIYKINYMFAFLRNDEKNLIISQKPKNVEARTAGRENLTGGLKFFKTDWENKQFFSYFLANFINKSV